MTFVELAATMSVLTVVIGSIVTATLGTQNMFIENQAIGQLNMQAELAMERVLDLASQALTTDPQFSPLKPSTGIDSHCLRFRLIQSVDAVTGTLIYDDNAQIHLYGPDSGAFPSGGLIVGRGPDLASIYAAGCGPDGFLGTSDDNTNTILSGTIPAVELLVPDRYAPQTGDMFTINVAPAPIGRFLTFTLRLNTRKPDGSFILPDDLVLMERLALKQ